ncbi:MAG: ABC transporter permease [Acidobacteriota bacterium]
MLQIALNELRNLCKAWRFQLLFLLGTFLFLFSSVTFSARYEAQAAGFDQFIEMEIERFRRADEVGAWSTHILQLMLPPDAAALVFAANGEYLPNILGFTVSERRRIRYGSSLDYNFAIPRFNRTDWTFLVGYLLSFAALVLSFDQITSEREAGTLRLLCSYSLSRTRILLGKYLASLIAIVLLLAAGTLASLSVLSLLAPEIPLGLSAGLLSVWAVSVVLVLSIYLALGLLMSTICASSSQSLYLALGFWVMLVIVLPSAAQLAAGYVYPARTASEVDREISLKIRAEAAANREGRPESDRTSRAARLRELSELYNEQFRSNLRQAKWGTQLSKLTPNGVLYDSLSLAFRSGIYRLEDMATQAALQADQVGAEVKRTSEISTHPIFSFVRSLRENYALQPPWRDWALLGLVNLVLLVAAGIRFQMLEL